MAPPLSPRSAFARAHNLDSQTIKVFLRQGGSLEEAALWQAGEDYLTCPVCGVGFGELTLHLRKTHHWTQDQLDDLPIRVSPRILKNRARSPAQRQAQSKKLKARFQTPEGEITRKQISVAAKAKMDSGYREVASAFLRNLNLQPEMRAAAAMRMSQRWEMGGIRKILEDYIATHPQEVRDSAAYARLHICSTSNLHLRVKKVLRKMSPFHFQTEASVGYYSIDEYCDSQGIAIEVMGCYWHSCPVCGLKGPPENLINDRNKRDFLASRGIVCYDIWEHDCKTEESIRATLSTLNFMRDL